jgi:hypothetical protein
MAALVGDGTRLVGVVAVEVQARAPGSARSGDGERVAVVVLDLLAQSVDVRDLTRDVRGRCLNRFVPRSFGAAT